MIYETLKLYEGRDDVTLTALVNNHSQEFLGDLKRPAVLICPGGGYMVCSETEGDPVAFAFLRMGYQAFVLHYSVYGGMGGPEGPGGPPPEGPPQEDGPVGPPFMQVEPKEHCVFPKPMLDIQAAMEKIAEKSEEWMVDPKQIALCGFSAGAHNVGLYSAYVDKMGFPRPIGTILGYPVGDMRLQENVTEQQRRENKNISIIMAGTDDLSGQEGDNISIIENISENTPPMFIWNTATDTTVNPIQSLRIAEALIRKGVPCELHTFESGVHGLSVADESAAVAGGFLEPEAAQWVSLASRWLKRRMKLTFPEFMPFG